MSGSSFPAYRAQPGQRIQYATTGGVLRTLVATKQGEAWRIQPEIADDVVIIERRGLEAIASTGPSKPELLKRAEALGIEGVTSKTSKPELTELVAAAEVAAAAEAAVSTSNDQDAAQTAGDDAATAEGGQAGGDQ